MGPKKPKKTKAELEEEKLAREEEERKAKILENKRIVEEEEKRKLEELRIQAEHKKNREFELERLNEEYIEITDDHRGKDLQLIAEEKQEASIIEWLHYKDPTDEPDASVERDMNTFITLLNETYVDDMQPTLSMIKNIENISRKVYDVWSESLATRNDNARILAHKNLIALKGIIIDKLDIATLKILRFSESHLNDRSEINFEGIADGLSIGIWASFADMRPIRKSVQFEKIGIQIDIQKQLLQNPHENYVFRVIRLPIVTYNLEAYNLPTELYSDYIANRAISTDNIEGISIDQGEGEEKTAPTPKPVFNSAVSNGIKYPSKYVVGDLFLFDIIHTPQAPFHLRVRKWTIRDNSTSSTKLRKAASYPSSVPCRVQLKVPDNIIFDDETRIAVWDDSSKDWTEDGITDFQYNETNRQVTFYLTTVGILAFVKPRGKCFPYSKWSLKPVVSKVTNKLIEARKQNIIAYQTHNQAMEAKKRMKESKRSAAKASTEAEIESLNISIAAGEDIHPITENEIKNEITVATTTSDIVNPQIEEPEIDLNEEFKDLSIYENLSMESSTSQELYERYARLIINTIEHEIIIDIIGAHCQLVNSNNSPMFTDLHGKLLHPGCLLAQLQRKGINLLPTSFDLNAINGSKPKDIIMEENVLKELARCASTLEFTSSSSWNQSLNQSQIGILAKESTVYYCFNEQNEYDCIFTEMDNISLSYENTPELGLTPGPASLKYLCVYGNEYGKRNKFSNQPRPSEITHLNIVKTLHKRITIEAIERINRINQRFQKTVHTLLMLIKPYSIC